MRTNKLLLTSALALLLLGSAACGSGDDMSGSAVQTEGDTGAAPGDEPEEPENPEEPAEPSKPEEPEAPEGPGADEPGGDDKTSSGASSLQEALDSHGDTERLAKEIIEEDCGDNAQCLEELDKLVEYIEGGCGGDGCAPNVEKFLEDLTPAQRQGVIPATFPQKRDLDGVAEDAVAPEAPDEGDESKGEEPGDEPAEDPEAADQEAKNEAVANVVDELRSLGGGSSDADSSVTWNDIVAMIYVEAETPEKANELAEEIQAALETGFAMDAAGTGAALLDGTEVDANDAADAVEAAWADQGDEG